jgi:hypothetical protein
MSKIKDSIVVVSNTCGTIPIFHGRSRRRSAITSARNISDSIVQVRRMLRGKRTENKKILFGTRGQQKPSEPEAETL